MYFLSYGLYNSLTISQCFYMQGLEFQIFLSLLAELVEVI